MDENEALGVAFGAFLMVFLVFGLAMAILMITSMWKVFEKAGKPGWAAIVPIYNTIVLLEIAGRPIWWIFLMLIPLANIVVIFLVYMDIAKSFGKDAGFAVGMFFLAFVFFPILGFGSARYLGPAAAPRPPFGPGGPYPPQQPGITMYPPPPPPR
jgi:hypothetical protein